VGRLLASLNINPLELPAEGPGLEANFDRIFAAAAPRLAQPSAASEHAASAAMAAAMQQQQQAHPQQQQWAEEFERLRLGEAGPSSSGWAAEYQQQQQQQQAQLGSWAEEFAEAEGDSAGWVNEFRSTAAAGSEMRQRAAVAAGSQAGCCSPLSAPRSRFLTSSSTLRKLTARGKAPPRGCGQASRQGGS